MADIGSETGNPISVDDAFSAPLCGLSVYGKSTQDGIPSPDTPVPIVSAGDGGSVTVKVQGKNLWDNFKTLSLGNIEQKKGTYIATTSTMQVDITPASVGARPLRLKAGNTYTFSLKTTVSISAYKFVCLKYTNGESKNIVFANIDFVSFVPEKDVENVGFVLYETVAGDKVYDVQLEMGSKATPYEPYREQLLTLPTPTGLPGIPVTSGGNYTDSTGQQWVCDEVDLERGVKVQRVGKGEIKYVSVSKDPKWYDANKSYSYEITEFTLIFLDAGTATELCNRFIMTRFNGFYDHGIETGGLSGQGYAVFNISKTLGICTTVEEFKAWFNENVVLYKILATPIETLLTPAELAAYKALTAYDPDTVVQAGDGAGIKLDYQRDVNIAIKKLEDAVASMT